MSTMLAARVTRQTTIVAAIGGLHVGAFILIGMGLGAKLRLPVLPEAAITVFVPPPQAASPIEPGRVTDPGFRLRVEPRPDVAIPRFEDRNPPSAGAEAGSGNVAGSGFAAPPADYRAPTLRTRDSRLAALIDACYPAASRRLGEEGRVVARLTIDAAGLPIAWSVEGSSGFVHLDSVLDCVIRRLEFIPGRRDGRGIEATVLLPIVFRLH